MRDIDTIDSERRLLVAIRHMVREVEGRTPSTVARKRQLSERMAFGEGYGGGEYVAVDETGDPYKPAVLTWRWGAMLDSLKIKRVRLHDARHSTATLMHLRGVPIAVIAAWLGHANAAFTMATYAHSQDEALQAAAMSFGRLVTLRDTETGSEG
jgi:integrase